MVRQARAYPVNAPPWCNSQGMDKSRHAGYPLGTYVRFGKTMLDPKLFDDLSRRASEGMPRGFQSLQDDFERNLRAALEAALRKMNLVSRDEFEIQQAVLQRTRGKLEALEKRVSELEGRNGNGA